MDKEFLKSIAVLVLAMILLVSAVVAWFGINRETDIVSFLISVETEKGDVHIDGIVDRNFVLPCATKMKDQTISTQDFSKALYFETFKIKVNSNVKKVTASVDESNADLHYYIVTDYADTYNALNYATLIKNNEDKIDQNPVIDFTGSQIVNGVYEKTVAVVFWADYTDAVKNEIINNKKMNFEATVVFEASEFNEAN